MMKFFILICLAVVASCERQRYDGCDVWNLKPVTEKQLVQLHNFYENHDDEFDREIIFWEEPRMVGHESEVLVCQEGVIALRHFLGYSGISGQISEHNIQSDLDKIFAENDARHTDSSRAYDPLAYNTYEDIMAHLDVLYANCPAGVSCTLSTIGTSIQNRNIRMFSMRTSSGNKGIFIDSLTHAREWLAGTTVLGIMDMLVNEYGLNSDVTRLVDDYNWYFVPVVNPDGYSYTWTNDRMWRKSRNVNQNSICTGTDINRNFNMKWGTPGASTSPCSETFRGSSAASEPETQVIQAQGEALRNELMLWLTFHTNGNYYLFPYGSVTGTSCDSAENRADQQRVGDATIRAIEEYSGQNWITGPTCSTLYAASGSTCDWAYGVGLVQYAYTPELRGPGFNPSPSNITPSIEENWNGLLAMLAEIEAIGRF